jgi:hypothetical protein
MKKVNINDIPALYPDTFLPSNFDETGADHAMSLVLQHLNDGLEGVLVYEEGNRFSPLINLEIFDKWISPRLAQMRQDRIDYMEKYQYDESIRHGR